MSEGAQAWVTLATNDSYALGALVLARSLRRVNTTRQLAVMVTPGISEAMRGILSDVFDVVNEVNILDSEDTAHLALLARPELGITFTKIHCWKLTQYTKCVFLDADTLVLQNCDELFDREEISAAPDAGWPDCFNSGVFVFSPSLETYRHVTDFALQHGSFDGGDQGLLNMFFRDWSQSDASHRLPFIYNMCASATYSYLPAYKVFGQNVKIVHFIGQEKPWLTFFDTVTGLARPPSGQEHLQEMLQAWWNIFRTEVHSRLSPQMGGGDNLSATMVEQVQASFSHIFIPAETSASSSPFSFQPPPPEYSYQSDPRPPSPPPPHQEHHDNSQPVADQAPPPPPAPQLLVAIQRYPPSHFWTPPPPPPPIVYHSPPPPPPHYSSPECSDSERNHQSPPPQSHNDNQAQNSSAGGSGSPQGNHSNDGSQNDGPNEQSHQNSQPNREETRQNVKRKKRSKSKGIAGVYAQTAMEGDKSVDQLHYEDHMRKSAWEQGHIDYMGKDSFDNIMKKIQASMAQTSVTRPPPKSPTPQRKQSPPKQDAPPTAAPVSTPPPETVPPPVIETVKESAPTPPVVTETPVVEPIIEATKTAATQSSAETQATATQATAETQASATQAVPKTQAAATQATAPEIKAKAAEEKAREEDRLALEERQAVERKLAEQKIAAEQKLEEEKQAAAARAAASAAATAAAAAKSAAAAAASSKAATAPKPEAPRAPIRKENTVLGNTVGVGLGLLGAAVVLVFAIYAAYSPTSFFL